MINILILILSSGEGDGAGSFPGSGDDPEQPGDPDLTGPLLLPHGGLRGGHQLGCCPENHHVPGDHQTRGPQGKTGFFIYFISVLRQVCPGESFKVRLAFSFTASVSYDRYVLERASR